MLTAFAIHDPTFRLAIEARLALEASRGNANTRKRARDKLQAAALELEPRMRSKDLRSLFDSELALLNSIAID